MFIRKVAAFGAACFALGLLVGLRPEPFRVTFLSVGQGDCAVIQGNGETILVDDGPRTPQFDAGERLVLPKLRELGVEDVDLILLSHPDLDHMGGTAALLRAFPDAHVAISAAFRGDLELQDHLKMLGIAPDRLDWLGPESIGRLGPLILRLACPPFHIGEEENDGSMFVHLGNGKAGITFSGDAPQKVEEEMLARGDWSSAILKAGHHGSRTATGLPWLQKVRPRWVILSCGRDNSYGHPHKETVDRILSTGAQALRTDRDGDITFELKSDHFERTF